jgi:radical SAM superfamily enzyme YgiQ (UPF0313 family)
MISAAGPSHERILVDLCFEPEPQQTLAARLQEFRPDLVALGMRNIQNADYTDTSGILDYYENLVRTIRASTSAPVVMGGGGFSVIPQDLMRRFDLDYGVVGEGELPFGQLVNRLGEGDCNVHGLHNVLCRDELAPTPGLKRVDFLDIQTNILPERNWVDARYYERSGITSIQTKRGCAMSCEYCTYPLIEGRVIRQRTGETVAREWQESIAAHPSIEHVFIVDSVFNLPPHHAREVCEALIGIGNRTPWTCYLNPIRFDPSLAELMARAGCAGVEIGSDSGTDAGLNRLRKGFTTEHIRATSRTCIAAGIKDCHTFILGTRDETLDDVRRSLDFIEELDPYSAILMAYKDDHEAVDAELAARLGAFRNQVLDLLLERARHRMRWIVPSVGLRFNQRLFDRLRKLGMRGPLWQHAR